VSITDLQEIKGLMSQLKTASGFAATLRRSIVSARAPIHPIAPPVISIHASDFVPPIRAFWLVLTLINQVFHADSARFAHLM
jgi:hypothetical protein